MDFVEMYYSNVVGSYPFETDEYKNKSQKTIDYLLDAGVSEELICKFIEEAPANDYIASDMLPEWLWDNSLLCKDSFYFHNILQITSKPPSFDPRTGKETVSPFFLEMKITYTMNDLIRYFYRKIGLDLMLLDTKRDSAAFKYLLDRYAKVAQFVEPIDFVLSLIDHAKSISEDGNTVRSIFDIKNYEQEVYKNLQNKVAEATLAKANKIIWR